MQAGGPTGRIGHSAVRIVAVARSPPRARVPTQHRSTVVKTVWVIAHKHVRVIPIRAHRMADGRIGRTGKRAALIAVVVYNYERVRVTTRYHRMVVSSVWEMIPTYRRVTLTRVPFLVDGRPIHLASAALHAVAVHKSVHVCATIQHLLAPVHSVWATVR